MNEEVGKVGKIDPSDLFFNFFILFGGWDAARKEDGHGGTWVTDEIPKESIKKMLKNNLKK